MHGKMKFLFLFFRDLVLKIGFISISKEKRFEKEIRPIYLFILPVMCLLIVE